MKRFIVLAIVIEIGLVGWSSAAQAGSKQDRAAARAEREANTKADREAQQKAREDARDKARAESEAKAKADAEARKDKRDTEKTPDRAKEIDKREANQARRIDHGIKKGYLTDDEVQKLQSQQDRITAMEDGIKSDGKITQDEFKSINDALNNASRCIWAEKHDTDGSQMPTYRLGKNVFAKDDFTAKMANENLPKDEAKALLKDFHRLTEVKRTLSTKDLTDTQRKTLQDEYNTLLNKYFEVR